MHKRAVRAAFALIWVWCVALPAWGQTEQDPPPPSAEELRWNDPALIVGETAPAAAYARWLPVPTLEDSARIVSDPPAAVKASCVGFIHSALSAPYVPADIAEHLVAVEASPTFEGNDVFVTWYTTRGVLVHLVETTNNLCVRVVDMQRTEPVPEEQRGDWLLARAAEILGPNMQPHPLTPPAESLAAWGIGDSVRLSWCTLVAPIEHDPLSPPGVLTLSLGSVTGPLLDAVGANTDGRCIRFSLSKLSASPHLSLPPWTGRFRPPPPPALAPPPPPWQPNLEPIEFKTELTAEEQANQVN